MRKSQYVVLIVRFSTDVIYNGGMNPFPSVENNTYPIFISGEGVWNMIFCLFFVNFFFFSI